MEDSPRVILVRSLAVLAVAALTYLTCQFTYSPDLDTAPGVILSLPSKVGTFWGVDQEATVAEKNALPPDTRIIRKSYDSENGDTLTCSIVLSGAQRRSIHRPEICLPSQGWSIHSSSTLSIPLSNGYPLKVTHLSLTREVQAGSKVKKILPSHFLYWFVGSTLTTDDHWERIFLTSWDRLVHHTNHRWAYIIVNAPVLHEFKPASSNSQQVLETLQNFIREIAPQVMMPRVMGMEKTAK